MNTPNEPPWLLWSRKLQAIAQSGLAFTQDPYDRERYEMLRALAAEIVAEHCDASVGEIATLFASERGYATPKLDVRGAVFHENRLLLVRETVDGGRWTLPGGWADVNESPTECVVKEVLEETGYDVRVRKLAAVWDRARHAHTPHYVFHIWKLFFVCDVVGGGARDSLESSEPSFFGRDELPADLSVGRVLPWQLDRMFEHAGDPNLRTDYD